MKKNRFPLPQNNYLIPRACWIIILFITWVTASSQEVRITTTIIDSSQPGFRTVIAGIEYKKGPLHRFFWGSHYRKEWTTPVKVPVINLDSIAGGLTATEQGGGRQTKTLRLEDSRGKEYVLRSVNKDYRGALPEIAQGTFIEDLARDQVSSAHPFAAITIPPLIEAAAIYHTNPVIVFVPYTPSLGKYNETFANLLCLFEERPDDDQSDASNFGFSKNVVGSEKLLENTREENDHQVEQEALVRARLFDMFIGDWGRHEDQWRWAKFDIDDFKVYRPIPRDRDQTWTKFDGFLTRKVTGAEALEHLQTFDHRIKNIKKYNFPARYLDRRFTNQVSRNEWLKQVKELQEVLTDSLIESSIRKLPAELFSISGPEIISKLKSRRDLLLETAEKYYKFIAQEVDVVGSEQNELFHINKINDEEVYVKIYDLNKEGFPKDSPFYSRHFHRDFTDEINIYGLKGRDIYRIEGSANNRIRIRIVGGPERDSINNLSSSSKNITYHDNRDNIITGNIRTRLSNDTAVHKYNYYSYRYNSGSTIIRPWYTNTRGINLQFGYDYTKQSWRKDPYGWFQALYGYYSIDNKSWGAEYEALFNQLLGKWDVALSANYDQKLEQYFFGFGNNTRFDFEKVTYEYYTSEAGGSINFIRRINKNHTTAIKGIFQSVEVLKNNAHTLSQQFPFNDPSSFKRKNFSGVEANYVYHNYNDEVIPTKGLQFNISGNRIFNISESGRSFNRYSGMLGFYLPLSKAISLAVRTGAATITGNPEFYQLATLGGGSTLRGYFRQRFHGKTIFYNGTDLRWIFNTRNYIFNGKIGLIAFFDNGRVWQPSVNSEQWHIGYGGGIMLAPFNKVALSVYYGLSEETSRFHIRLGKLF